MSQLFIVRHAEAGSRNKWVGPDAERPLSKKGLRQALVIAEQHSGISRIVSSPYLRCQQTVQPLGEHVGVKVESVDELAEGNDPLVAFEWLCMLSRATDGLVVGCTHGDLLDGFLEILSSLGPQIALSVRSVEKGAGIAIDLDAFSLVSATYVFEPRW